MLGTKQVELHSWPLCHVTFQFLWGRGYLTIYCVWAELVTYFGQQKYYVLVPSTGPQVLLFFIMLLCLCHTD